MSGLGIRYCPQHPDTPLILRQNGAGLWWACEHTSGCAHTENAVRVGPKSSVTALSGRRLHSSGLKRGYEGQGSEVEGTLVRRERESTK